MSGMLLNDAPRVNTVDVVPEELEHVGPQFLEVVWATLSHCGAQPNHVAPFFHRVVATMFAYISVPMGKPMRQAHSATQFLHSVEDLQYRLSCNAHRLRA